MVVRDRDGDAADEEDARNGARGRETSATRTRPWCSRLDEDVVAVEPFGVSVYDRIICRSVTDGRIREEMLRPARRCHVSLPGRPPSP